MPLTPEGGPPGRNRPANGTMTLLCQNPRILIGWTNMVWWAAEAASEGPRIRQAGVPQSSLQCSCPRSKAQRAFTLHPSCPFQNCLGPGNHWGSSLSCFLVASPAGPSPSISSWFNKSKTLWPKPNWHCWPGSSGQRWRWPEREAPTPFLHGRKKHIGWVWLKSPGPSNQNRAPFYPQLQRVVTILWCPQSRTPLAPTHRLGTI